MAQRGSRGRVVAADGELTIDGYGCTAPEVVRHFAARVDDGADEAALAADLEQVLRVGVLALGATGVTVNVDHVDREFARLCERLEQQFDARASQLDRAFEAAFSEEDGAMAQALRSYLGEGGALSELFDPDRRDSAIGRMRELLGEHFEGEGSTLHRLLDLGNAASPLATWRDEIHGQFEKMRRLIEDYRRELAESASAQQAAAEARTEERAKGTAKGRDYEDLAFEAVNDIARVFGDRAEAVGTSAGAGGNKKGDIVVTLNPRDTSGLDVRLVVEAKDRELGLRPMLRELDGAKHNRGAVAALALYALPEHMPSGAAPFREEGQGRFLVLFDKDGADARLALEVGYRLARFEALTELRTADVEVDTRGIRDDLDAARAQLVSVSQVKSMLTKLRNDVSGSVDDLERRVEDLRAGLLECLDRLDTRIRVGDETDAAVA